MGPVPHVAGSAPRRPPEGVALAREAPDSPTLVGDGLESRRAEACVPAPEPPLAPLRATTRPATAPAAPNRLRAPGRDPAAPRGRQAATRTQRGARRRPRRGAHRGARSAEGAAAPAPLHAASRLGDRAARAACAPRAPLAARRTLAALASPLDLWGKKLLAAPGGPSLALARAYLPPLFEARAARQSSLTHSGSYYLPFAEPVGPLGIGAVALHLADGSQIVSQTIGGPSLTIGVGSGGRERFGSCLARLSTPRLGDGYLPILETRYRDAEGASYRQESFAASPSGLPGLTSFLRLQVDTRAARGPVELRFALSTPGLHASAGRLLAGGDTELLFSPGGRLEGSSLLYRLGPGRVLSVEVAFLDRPGHTRPAAAARGGSTRALGAPRSPTGGGDSRPAHR